MSETKQQSEGTLDVSLDILIIGGGVQGLTLLQELVKEDFASVLLVTRDKIGQGETLHSHGGLLRGHSFVPMNEFGNKFVKTMKPGIDYFSKFLEDHKIASTVPTYGCFPSSEKEARVKFMKENDLQFKEIKVSFLQSVFFVFALSVPSSHSISLWSS
jgi:glycine/D-amino acid oxidase-like deaminating enzyme